MLYIFLLVLTSKVFGRFFMDPGSGISGSDPNFVADPDSGKKKSDPDPEYVTHFFYLYLQFLAVFFMDPDPEFPDRIRIFWPIRTQEKSLIRIRTKGPASETLHFTLTE